MNLIKLIFLLSFLFIKTILISQNLSSGFNSSHAGRSISTTYSIEKKNHEIGFGIGVNINQKKHNDDQENIFYKRLYASTPIQYFALKGFYHRTVNLDIENIKPFVFYDLQVRFSKTRNRFTSYTVFDTTLSDNPLEQYYVGEAVKQFGPFTWIEQTIGVGFDLQFHERLFLRQKFGVGTSFILGIDDEVNRFQWFHWEFGALYNIEIGYKLN